ncbi:hypothetical protein [Moraxella catarrhalis]|uniref:hypothetical protein n=1 Tax=Moraxella catarrhalis TaxID=480 RepID=UPI001883C9E8|nr:hypothetical protein [Moraxella catarrhalis]
MLKVKKKDSDGNPIRWLQTQPDTKYHTKDRSGKLSIQEPANLSIIQQKILGA